MNPAFRKKNNNNFYYLKELQWTNKAAKLNSLQKKLNSQNPINNQPKIEQMNLIKEKSWNNRFVYSKIPNYDATKDKNVLDPNLLKFPSCNCYYNAIRNNNTINNQPSRRNIRGKNHSLNHKTMEKTYLNCSAKNIPNSKMLNPNSSCNEIFLSSKINNRIFSPQINDANNLQYNPDKLTKLWNDLCILDPYRELFNLIISQLNDEKKNDIYKREINELSELKNNIQILSASVFYRTKTLEELNLLNDKLGLILKSKQTSSNEVILKNISKKIQNLREYTINLCLAMKKIKEQINSGHPWGKFEMDDISEKYKFDKNYLIKMKDEMSVLREGYAKYFFNINNDQTPFLVNASEPKDTDNNNKIDPFMHKVPMSDELKENINQCTYIIYQELIGYQNNNVFQNNFRSISPLKKYKYTDIDIKIFKKQNESLKNSDKNIHMSNSILIKSNGFSPYKTYDPEQNNLKNNNYRPFSVDETMENNGKNLSFNNYDIIDNFNQNFKYQINSNPNYGGEFRSDINEQKEFNNYNKYNDEVINNKYNNNNNISYNINDKKKGENEFNENNVVIEKVFTNEKKNENDNINNNNQENLEKKNNLEEKKEDNINLNKEKKNNKEKEGMPNSNNIIDNMINNEQVNKNELDENQNSNNIDNEHGKGINKEQNNNNIRNNAQLNDDIKNNNNKKESKKTEIKINKDNNNNLNKSEENKEEEKKEIKDNNFNNVQDKEEVKKDNIDEEEKKQMIQKIKMINSNSNKIGNSSSKKHNMNLINAISPSLKSKKLKVITFTDDINIFTKDFYNYYYLLIPTEIKEMFKIQEDICSNLFKGISPYLLVLHEELFPDQDNWMNLRNSIFAICTMNYKYKNDKLKIIINHISSSIVFSPEKNKYYLNDINYIFDIMIKYIKNEFYFDEIVIEYDNKKANEELINIFINDLNFSIDFEDNEEESKKNKENKLIYVNDSTTNTINDMIRQTASSYLGKTIFNIFNSLLITNNSKYSFVTDTNMANKESVNNTLKKSSNDIINNNNDNLINIISMNYLMEINGENNINILYNKLTKLDQLIKVFQKNKIKNSEIPLSIAYNRFDILSCVINSTILNNCFSNSTFFNNYNTNNPISFLDKNTNIYYNFIKPEKIYVLYNDKYRIKFYHLVNNNISLFLCNMNNELLDYLNKNNIYTQMNELYKGAIEDNKKEILIDKIIWIPCFEIYNHYQSLSNNSEGVIHEYVKISNKAIKKKNKEILKLNKQIKENTQMKIEPDTSRDILFNSDFIFGIVNNSNLGFKKEKKKVNDEENNEIKKSKDSDLPNIIFLSYINKNNFITNVNKKE